MAFTKRIEFGNFTLKFGDDLVLLDRISEIVWPAFEEKKYIRSIRDKATFFLLDTRIISFHEKDGRRTSAIAGRIVKNTTVTRDQYYRSGTLIPSKKELASAPSSIFVLILSNHRLLYTREVSNAPTIQNFSSTIQNFLKRRHQEYLHELRTEISERNQGKIPHGTQASLLRSHPTPRLRVTPLSDSESLSEFIRRFETIDQLTIKLLPTNKEEIDNDDFWNDFDRRREKLKSEAATVKFSKSSDDGLDAGEVISQTAAATGMGNSEVTVRGHDNAGDLINGNNEDFSLTIPLDELSTEIPAAARKMYAQFKGLANRGLVTLPTLGVGVFEKIREFINKQNL